MMFNYLKERSDQLEQVVDRSTSLVDAADYYEKLQEDSRDMMCSDCAILFFAVFMFDPAAPWWVQALLAWLVVATSYRLIIEVSDWRFARHRGDFYREFQFGSKK